MSEGAALFPLPLERYGDAGLGLWETLRHRVAAEPFNALATGLFFAAILHTFFAPQFLRIAHRWRDAHARRVREEGRTAEAKGHPQAVDDVSFRAELLHFFGEVEAIFGLWVVPLLLALTLAKGWPATEAYVSRGLHFTEPLFVVIIMAISATRPVLRFAERCLAGVARLGGGGPGAWWVAILTVGPLLGSLVTEPAAMTISALLLARQFYDRGPGERFRYATLGLLFVNICVGGLLTNFAAPPVLMVASRWGWSSGTMLSLFGWKAILGIVGSTALIYALFRREFAGLSPLPGAGSPPSAWSDRTDPVPGWITAVHLLFLAWTVFTAHFPVLFIGGFLFFLAFTTATEHHQNPLSLKPAILVGFFLAGLVIHGGLQGWWIQPVLSSLSATPLLLGAAALTALNDNAAITYLASLVPNFPDTLRYAVVAGACVGGGLTVIGNAPNPAGQSILASYFEDGVSPWKLFLGALPPTLLMVALFLLLP